MNQEKCGVRRWGWILKTLKMVCPIREVMGWDSFYNYFVKYPCFSWLVVCLYRYMFLCFVFMHAWEGLVECYAFKHGTYVLLEQTEHDSENINWDGMVSVSASYYMCQFKVSISILASFYSCLVFFIFLVEHNTWATQMRLSS